MGFRFRKSVKIAPGVKLNLNKKSTSITVGGKGVHHTVSSSGRKTTTVGIPGTGLSYSQSSSPKRNSTRKTNTKNNYYDNAPRQHVKETYVTEEVLDENAVSTCPNCGATVRGSVCPYCETPLDVGTKTIRTQRKETVDIPNVPNEQYQAPSFRQKHPITFWFLMFCVWPFALGYWFYKTDKINLDKKYRIAILIVLFILFYTIGSKENESSLTPLFGMAGLLGFLISTGLLIWNKIKKQSITNALIGIIVSILVFVICLANSPNSNTTDSQTEDTKIEEKSNISNDEVTE